MIQIAVITRQGVRVGQPVSADFGPEGGTIGRAGTNTLVLDDPGRTVSRVHAQVLCRDGQYFIVDRGSNPMQCNGVPLGCGKEAEISDGVRLVVGTFELAVHVIVAPGTAVAPVAASNDDPFADLLAGLAPPPPRPVAARVAVPSAPADALVFPDVMKSGSRQAQAVQGSDPFADLLEPSSAAELAAGAGALDDFSDLGVPPVHGRAAGIDALFGGMGDGDGAGSDPLALSPLADPLRQPNTASDADPLAAFERAAPATSTPRSDHLPIGQFGFTPPNEVTPSPVRMQSQPAKPEVRHSAAPEVPATLRTASDSDLLDALLRGLASTHQLPKVLTPELMERIGSTLRASTEGTLQLLLTRQEFKREVRAEVTMIASQANNPLKFSPTVEVALAHLLGPGVRGFMPPEAAMRDAYDDLRAHQFGVMVGMRAALAHVIARFEPAELEKKITEKSALDSLFIANRKARLWDQFVALYAGIASEAGDDFHSLFGKAFVAAYEEQMARLQAGDTSRPPGH